MTSPTTTLLPGIQSAGCAKGGTTVTLTLTCTTVADACKLFTRLRAAIDDGELTTLLRSAEVGR